MQKNLYLGLDLSTQSLTARVIDPSEGELQSFSINFDQAYPAYHTQEGVLFGNDPEGYDQTSHITLVSSFVTSLLTGWLAPVDPKIKEY